jgi:hypothetical protein
VWFGSKRTGVASWYSAPSSIQSLAWFRQQVMARGVIYLWESHCLARAVVCHYWQALGTLVLSAAGRSVVRVEAHGRCVLVQCIMKNSIARLFRQLVMAREVIFESRTASPARWCVIIGKHWAHSCFQHQVAVWFGSKRTGVVSWYSA